MRIGATCASNEEDGLPPVRAISKPVEVVDTLKTIKSSSQRIASSDYNRWEKYDAGMIAGNSWF